MAADRPPAQTFAGTLQERVQHIKLLNFWALSCGQHACSTARIRQRKTAPSLNPTWPIAPSSRVGAQPHVSTTRGPACRSMNSY
eukprot:4038419-Amphidinium_carterae.1